MFPYLDLFNHLSRRCRQPDWRFAPRSWTRNTSGDKHPARQIYKTAIGPHEWRAPLDRPAAQTLHLLPPETQPGLLPYVGAALRADARHGSRVERCAATRLRSKVPSTLQPGNASWNRAVQPV